MLNSLFEKKEINTGMKKDITELYSFIDDFCKIYYEYEKKKLMDLKEKIMLRKRNLIETIFDYLKNKMNLEHTRHRSPINAFVHILFTLVAYSLKKNKPSINCRSQDLILQTL
ncbi:transposase [Candidatus Tisiphia endosymbiont of Dioctria rufipes]|uniref:transposase n=1 Tax=Candidatus Tisiphia endosymbiont of Dioctria rufipes TaxID=3066255 RepID=UPI0039772653